MEKNIYKKNRIEKLKKETINEKRLNKKETINEKRLNKKETIKKILNKKG